MVELTEIGIIHSPYENRDDAPRQGRGDTVFEIEIFEEFEEGLEDIEEFSHLHIFYWLHKSKKDSLKVVTPSGTTPRGVFTTRSPHRPNPIAHSVISLLEKNGRILRVHGLDAIDGTPVLDIKPYISKLDSKPDAEHG